MYGLNEAHYMDANQPYVMVFMSINSPPIFCLFASLQWYKPKCWNKVELNFAHVLIIFFLL